MSEGLCVLDSSAVLCVIFGETGSSVVSEKLQNALICAVNLAEIISKLQDKAMPEQRIDDIVAAFNLVVTDFDEELAIRAGKLRHATRAQGLSLGDRACLALAMEKNAVALTTDRAWQDVNCGARVLVVR